MINRKLFVKNFFLLYLLLSLQFVSPQKPVESTTSHQIRKVNLSVHLFFESEVDTYDNQKRSVAMVLRVDDAFLYFHPDNHLIYANLTLDFDEHSEFRCAASEEMNHNSSLINSNVMGPMWNTMFQNLRHHKLTSTTTKSLKEKRSKRQCKSMMSMSCEGITTEQLIPLNPEIIPLKYKCQNGGHRSIQVDVLPVLMHWYSTESVVENFYKPEARSLLFSLVIDELLIQSNVTRGVRGHRSTPIETSQRPSNFILTMGYTLERRCFTEEVMDHHSDAEHAVEDGVNKVKVCNFRKYCPTNACGISCDFEEPCEWRWDEGDIGSGVTGFQLTSGKDVIDFQKQIDEQGFEYSGPQTDAQNDTEGHFLLLAFTEAVNKSAVYHLKSPWFSAADAQCHLEALVHMNNMNDGTFKFLMHTKDHTAWVPLSKLGNNNNMWERLKSNVGKTTQPFQISLEVIPSSKVPSHIAVDNIRLVNCFPQPLVHKSECSQTEFRCRNDICIERSQICDFSKDCLHGEDEENCDKMPKNTSCNFEDGWCGWTNVSERNIKWERTNRMSPYRITGPADGDHTYSHLRNMSGYYLNVHMNVNNSLIMDKAMLRSTLFAPPPFFPPGSIYNNSCQLRFFYHMFGPHIGSLHVDVIESNPKFPKSTRLIAIDKDRAGNIWRRVSIPLPKLDHLYYIEFVATRGRRYGGDIALDDISLSPECVGQRVPNSELKGYSYETELKRRLAENRTFIMSVDMENVTKYTFTTCNNLGRNGPTPEQCETAYRNTPLNGSVAVLTDEGKSGVQVWTVPESKHYTFVAKGASGGRGAVPSTLTSSGSMTKATVFLKQGEKVYILVGQEGASVCDRRNTNLPAKLRETCRENLSHGVIGRIIRASKGTDAITELNRMSNLLGGGGGGGGATFVFKMEDNIPTILFIAAGGGGLAYNALPNISPYGGGYNTSLEARCGASVPHGAGGGGGWKGEIIEKNMEILQIVNEKITKKFGTPRGPVKDNTTMWISAGGSFLDGGGVGGLPCADAARWGAEGGFGGGGGGCTAGGGGGGFVGGNAHNGPSSNGEGGLSYITKYGLHPLTEPGGNDGPGSVVVIPSIEGCGCDFRCILLEEFRFHPACVCPENQILSEDGYACSGRESPLPLSYLIGLILIGVVIFASVGLLCIFLYSRYQRRKAAILRRKVLGGPELQLSRLRAASGPGGVLTEYNPNYEFGGETYSVADLKEIPRENLRLIKALGQGAFGEVYQGFYKHRAGDTVEMPVAVKTLPELSSNQAEMDFLMEALIMSKFNHPNIVHFIGVCFDKHPRFIILELLAGGDLKTFLRESRPKPERGSPLAMKDLLLCAIDVAKGCKYLEENHFIHRDIAARNCLLTSKGPGRVVKIADFGMARDIYRADYYKKGGKAMLPVKWMPPEAFLDGLFTSKTDVWSYGVLLWEVFSLGYMPYPGRGNQDVMQLVTNGGRLEPPSNCPPPVYGIMTQCWHPIPEERPTFSTLLERVGYCLQDPEVVNAPLPVFQRPPSSSDRDTTIMRPPLNPDDQSCLRIVHRSNNPASMNAVPLSPNSSTADYLVPLAPYSFSSNNRVNSGRDSQVTSPTSPIPESESTQTLLEDDEEEESKPSTNIYKSAKIQNQQSNQSQAGKKPNGMENGLTLNPATLDKAASPNPVPYANVGVKKPSRKIEEEIRC